MAYDLKTFSGLKVAREAMRVERRRRNCVSRIGFASASQLQPPTGAGTTFSASQGFPIDPRANWSDVEILFANLGNNYNNGPNGITLRAAAHYPPSPSGVYSEIWSPGGARDIVLEPGAMVSCRVPVVLKGGDILNIRQFGTVPADGKWCLHERLTFYADPGNRYETPSTDKTLAGSIANLPGAKIPTYIMAITGIPDRDDFFPTWGIVGDSISVGAGENTATIEQGFIVRALQNTCAWIHFGQSGGSVSGLMSDTGLQQGRLRRRAVAMHGAGITHVLCNLGTNDIGTSADQTAEQTIAGYTAMAEYFAARGIVVVPMTIPPRTDAANTGGYYGTDTQTQRDRRNALNAWVRSDPFGYGYFDASAYAEDPGDADRWRSDLGSPTDDGLHPSPVIHAAMAAGLKLALPVLGNSMLGFTGNQVI